MKDKPQPLKDLMQSLTADLEGQYDRHGNFIFTRNGHKHRLHPAKRVVRLERHLDMGDHKEWVRLRSYTKKVSK